MLNGKSHKELLGLSRLIVQPLRLSLHKGQAGKIAVVGGSEDYTGAPFFAAHLAALVGADLSHVVCERAAGSVIKTYSPDLMVHPYLYQLSSPEVKEWVGLGVVETLLKMPLEQALAQKAIDDVVDARILPRVVKLLERIDTVVVGPGFGRDPLMLKTLVKLVEQIRVLNKPVILDADALYLLSLRPQLVHNYAKAVVTPNVVEFARLASAIGIDYTLDKSDQVAATVELSSKLGVTVFCKGAIDVIARNGTYVTNDTRGSLRRVGGQGDTLSGALATLITWAYNFQDNQWDRGKVDLDDDALILLACYAASTTVRRASEGAFEQYGRAMQTSNVHEFVGPAFTEWSDETLALMRYGF